MKGLSNNQLKIIAVISMTVDHIGHVLFPQVLWLRMVGRLAFPVFAFMIAQGCRHTRSMGRYLGSMAATALVCQLVMFIFAGSLYQTVLVTFTMSIGLIWLLQKAQKEDSVLWVILGVLGYALAYGICDILPRYLQGTDYAVDYGLIGVLIPVAVYLAATKTRQLLILALGLSALALDAWEGQWLALLAVPLLAFYNGQRGKYKLKWFFYGYFPLHLAVLYSIAWLL